MIYSPNLVIIKNRGNASGSWIVKHSSLTSSKVLFLDNGNAEADSSYGEIADLSSNVTVTLDDTGNNAANVNKSSDNYIMYAWTAIPGYSAFGKYAGSGSGLMFRYCGFTPELILIKNISTSTDWLIHDYTRDTINPVVAKLEPNTNEAESTGGNGIDFLSNGFNIRENYGGGANGGGNNYVWAAFAKSPFKISRAQ